MISNVMILQSKNKFATQQTLLYYRSFDEKVCSSDICFPNEFLLWKTNDIKMENALVFVDNMNFIYNDKDINYKYIIID